jgi:UDP-2,4-diacetamido-2,4,6-trideoxy-beta-L-altropyranose hydrolase
MREKHCFLIRVDASPQMGAGHLMRMLALGQLLADSGNVVHFVTIPYSPAILNCIEKESFYLHYLTQASKWDQQEDLDSVVSLIVSLNPSWVILDGYQFSTTYEQTIIKKGVRLLKVDDLPTQHCVADILLDQNHGAEQKKHSIASYTKILAGLKYLLLRREFRIADTKLKAIPTSLGPIHILVSLGGGTEISDSLNFKIVQSFAALENWNGSATVIVGKMGKISQQLIELANQVSWEINVSEHVENMVPEMLKSDIAIVSGGSTMWELLYMKVPFLAISLNKVQQSYLEFLELEELCVNLGWYEQLSLERINNTLCDFVQDETYRSKILDHADLLLERENNGKELLMSLNAHV